MIIAKSVEIPVRLSRDVNVFDSCAELFLAAAISRIPTVMIPIIEKKTK